MSSNTFKKASISLVSELDLESLKRLVMQKILPGAQQRDKSGEFPLELLKELHELGYLQSFVPERLGGLGARTTDLIWMAREIAKGSAGISSAFAAHMAAMIPLLHFAPDALQKHVAQDVLSRFALASFCFTEPDAGSDVSGLKTRATKVEGGYVISGQKCLISNANYADHFVVVARVEGVDPKRALTLFYVPKGTKGLSTGSPLQKLGQKDSNVTEVYLDEVFVPEKHRIGEEGEGFKIAVISLQKSRTTFAAAGLGLADRALELVENHLRHRVHYEKPLLSQPAIRGVLAQLATEHRAAWYLTCVAASHWDESNYQIEHSSMAKMFAGQTCVKIVGACLELFGGWGYTQEFEIERLYRDAKLFELIEGPTLVQQVIIAKELFPERAAANVVQLHAQTERKKAA